MNKYFLRVDDKPRVLYFVDIETIYGIYVDKKDEWEDLLAKGTFSSYVAAYNYAIEHEPVDLKWAKLRGLPECQ